MDDEHALLRARVQLPRRLLLGQVEAPRPRCRWDAATEPEERHAVDLDGLAVQDRCRLPALTGLAERVVGLVVAGHEHCGRLDHDEHVDHLFEPAMHRREVAGGDPDLGVGRHLGQPRRLSLVAVYVAEREQPHYAESAIYAAWNSPTSPASFSTFPATSSRGSGRTYQTSRWKPISRSRSIASGSLGAADPVTGISSRPASPAFRWSSSTRRAISSRSVRPRLGIHSSPKATTRSSTLLPLPPTSTGGWGFWTGFGHDQIGSKLTCCPWYSASSSVQMAFIASIRSRISEKRRWGSVPWFSISSRFQPAPTPKRKRPSDRWSRLATSLAVVIGSRSTTRQMPVASLSRSVASATVASATNGSWGWPVSRSGVGVSPLIP